MTNEQERTSEIDHLTKMLYYDGERRSVFKKGVEYADSHPKNTWVSVKDSLPPDDLYVLTVSNTHVQEVCRRDDGKWINNHNQEEHGKITHWQTLPKIPTNEIYE